MKTEAISSFKNSEVKQVFKRARFKEKFKGLEIYLAPSLLPMGRILVVTPKKSGNSPERNLIRRRLKSIFFEGSYSLKAIDCIVIVRKEGIDLDFQLLKEFINSSLRKYEAAKNSISVA